MDYPWDRSEGSADRIPLGTPKVNFQNFGSRKYVSRIPYTRHRIVNINVTNTSSGNPDILNHQTNMVIKDNLAGFKQYDESPIVTDELAMFAFVQLNESNTDKYEKHGTLDQYTPTGNVNNLTPVKYLKLKTRERTPAPPVTEYEYESYKLDATTNKDSDDKNTDRQRMLNISGLDLMALLSQLRAENRNYSLQILV